MIRTIKLDLNAAYPNMPLEPVNVFAGSAASFTVCNVPRSVGDRAITSLALSVSQRTGNPKTYQAVRVGSAYEVTVPAADLSMPFSASLGVRVIAAGTDENKAASTWVLGVADLNVLNSQGQITPGADAGDVKHSEFSDLDPDTSSLADVITRLKGSAMSLTLVLTSLLVSLTSLAALPVTPVYTNHNRVAGNVQTMTNLQQWASAVESAIGQGGGSMDTNAVSAIITNHVTSGYLAEGSVVASHTSQLSQLSQNKADEENSGGTVMRRTSSGEYNGSTVTFVDGIKATTDITIDDQGITIDKDPGQYPDLWHLYRVGNAGSQNLQTLPQYVETKVSSSALTNAGAKAYSDATFSRMTTNDVCNIVTNDVDVFSEWTFTGSAIVAGKHYSLDFTNFTVAGSVVKTWNLREDGTIINQSYWGGFDEKSTLIDYWDMGGLQGDYCTAKRTKSTANALGLAYRRDVPSTNGLVTAQAATNAATAVVTPVSDKVEYIEGYIAGQRVRVCVTNYYGNTSGQLPRLRIEEFVTATNVVDGVATETNYWQIVWDEQNKYDRFMTEATTAIAAMTNNLYQTYYALLQERLATKAPRAWGTLTSAGEAAPQGTVWQTEPNTVFAGGTEYAHAMVGTGVIGVLQSKGAAVYTDGETGRFHFTTDDKMAFFGMNIATRYELGCATDGITVTSVGGNNMVDLLYNVTMTGKPILYYKTNLVQNAWEQITDSSGGSIPGATVYASWDQSPPAGSEICTINCGSGISGYFKASIEYAGVSKFETNMMADLAGGIVATNQTNNQLQPVEPYITNGSVMWRVKQ